MSIKSVQQRLISMGFSMPRFGADGSYGSETEKSINAALDELSALRSIPEPVPAPLRLATVWPVIPAEWMPVAKMDRIIVHWTAGRYAASDLDRNHYHMLVEGDGYVARGKRSIKDNEVIGNKSSDEYAAHTRACNTRSIGVSMCCMAGAIERPFNAGQYPMLKVQWDSMTSVVAQLCKRYGIAVTDKTVLSHAEVQPNLGIAQSGKWDFSRLAFDLSINGPAAAGSKMRNEVKAKLAQL